MPKGDITGDELAAYVTETKKAIEENRQCEHEIERFAAARSKAIAAFDIDSSWQRIVDAEP